MTEGEPDPGEQSPGAHDGTAAGRPRSYRSRMITGLLVVTVPLVVLLLATLTTIGSRTVESAISQTLEEGDRAAADPSRPTEGG